MLRLGAVSSAAAFDIFCRFCFGRKVRCHKGAAERLGGRVRLGGIAPNLEKCLASGENK